MKTHASERAGKRASKTSESGEDVRMTQPAKSQEPSMEEILASIRRIIADDDSNKSATRAPEPPKESQPEAPPRPRVDDEARPAKEPSSPLGSAAVADPASDIFDLTESMAAPMPQSSPANPPAGAMPNPAAQFRTIDGNSDVGFDEASERPAAPAAEERGRLISSETSAAVDFGLQCARANRAGAERPHAGGFGARNAPADAEILAR